MTVSRIQLCWGALVNESWVITAAHCNVTTSDWVVAGLYDPSSGRKDIQILKVAQVILHPQLNLSATDNDVALLKLARPARLSTPVYPASLPTASDHFRPGHLCLTLGFMFPQPYASKHPKELQEAMMTILTNINCRKYGGTINTDANICAGTNGVSCWEVDFGAPLVCRKKKVWTLAGVKSFMSETCPTLKPLVFTRITKIVPWIQETMANN
ncbi:chymotrypsinogen B-like [Talpa occidentalis]|uniref:chymotrypsinogen B-like n=1 Tax=Talpa occidentalis TaxID=50954 RepID=UPI00188F5770|nr:chymotrypsinogen B-like [Talpa occidentalis]